MKLTKTDTSYIIEGEAQCSSCEGTGLYQGMGERNGAAVICCNCDGTGKVQIKNSFKIFTEKRKKIGVKRVYVTGCGYCIGAEDVTEPKTGRVIHFSQAGVAYRDWVNGEKPLPIKDLHCPYMHTNQNLQSKDVNGLYKTRCRDALTYSMISECKLFCDKEKCWEIYEGKKKS